MVEVIILSDLVNSESVGAILRVLEAPRLLDDRSWCLLHFVFFLFVYVRLVVLSDCEQFLSPQSVIAVDCRVWIIECARLPASIMKLGI